MQIRDIPDKVHSTLTAPAKREGMSLSGYLKRELEQLAELPSVQEWLDLAGQEKPIPKTQSPAELIRRLRYAH